MVASLSHHVTPDVDIRCTGSHVPGPELLPPMAKQLNKTTFKCFLGGYLGHYAPTTQTRTSPLAPTQSSLETTTRASAGCI